MAGSALGRVRAAPALPDMLRILATIPFMERRPRLPDLLPPTDPL